MENEQNPQLQPNDDSPPADTSKATESTPVTKPMHKSHLRRKLEKQSKRTLVLTGFGVLVVFILLIIFGTTLLINLSLFVASLRGKTQNTVTNEQQQEEPTFIAPPSLNPVDSATNSATIKITGLASNKKDQVKLYRNNELVDIAHPNDDNKFVFDSVTLKEGENNFKAIESTDTQKSGDSNIVTIFYSKKAPSLTVDNPQDGESLKGDSMVIVRGKTDPGMTVTVNDHIAITKNDGSFSYALPLQGGDNAIKVIATDEAGNKTEKDLKVSYSQ